MLRWLQFGDLHACEGDDWNSLGLLERIVAQVNAQLQGRLDFAVLPGDNANHATAEQFHRISEVASNL
jgi:Icc protein